MDAESELLCPLGRPALLYMILHVSGELDRERLGELVFNDAISRRKLNKATHPAVTLEIAKQLLRHLLRGHRLVVGSCPTTFVRMCSCLAWS